MRLKSGAMPSVFKWSAAKTESEERREARAAGRQARNSKIMMDEDRVTVGGEVNTSALSTETGEDADIFLPVCDVVNV